MHLESYVVTRHTVTMVTVSMLQNDQMEEARYCHDYTQVCSGQRGLVHEPGQYQITYSNMQRQKQTRCNDKKEDINTIIIVHVHMVS